MTVFNDSMIEVAVSMLDEFGQTAIFRSKANPISTNGMDWRPTNQDPNDITVKMAFLPRRRQTQETQYIINGSDLPTGMTTVLVAPMSVLPTTKDVIIRDGIELRIESINTINVNGQIILHKMVVDG